MKKALLTLVTLGLAASPPTARAVEPEAVAFHYQATIATQQHPAFSARYSGANSLQPGEEAATSVVADLFAGIALWPGAELQLQPELSGGRGLSGTLGVAAFPSGEVYRVGSSTPAVTVARLFLRQVVGLGGGRVEVEPGPGALAGARDRDALTFLVGKLATTDLVDAVPTSSDPHTRFSSWALFASGAYDYPADTHGYTWGAAADLTLGAWSGRAGLFLEPTTPNGMNLEWRLDRSHGLVAELERRHTLNGQPGAARLLVFANTAPMGSYREALDRAVGAPALAPTRASGRTKYGLAASANQAFAGGLSVFLRVSANDGATETWAFTEIDRSLALGAVQSGARWGRPDDEAGLAGVVSGLSDPHRRYLAAGGYGFIVGDGALRYAPEVLLEAFYRLALTRELSLAGVYQPVFNPAFNRDRGPVQIVTGRLRAAF
jgi:high affinity Mn2+ porin